MQHNASEYDENEILANFSYDIPELLPPDEKELNRRRVLVERARQLRERIGPIGITTGELKHLARAEEEE